jgi:hypothetical protein
MAVSFSIARVLGVREESWGRDQSRDRNVAGDFTSEIIYYSLFFFTSFHLHVIYSFSLVSLHHESFLILYFHSHPSTSCYYDRHGFA